MKKIIAIGLIAIWTNPAQAQKGFLGKLSEKLEQATASSGNATAQGVNEKELKTDVASTTLDGKPINKDSRNLSGIYYSNNPVRIGIIGSSKYNFAQKFLINYFEGDNVNDIEITTRYTFENRKDILPLVYRPALGNPDYFPVTTSKKMGKLLIDGVTDKKYQQSGSSVYTMYNNLLNFSNAEGNYLRQPTQWFFNNNDILEIEPGILVATTLEYIINANTPEKYKYLQENGTYILYYKKEKEEKALAMTKAQVWDQLKEFYTPYYAKRKAAEGSNVELAKPIGKFKDEPTNAKLVEAAKERIASMPHLKQEELVYLYPVSSWENRFENIGIMGRTLTHRVMQVQVVLKQGDECKMTQFLIRQDNTYTGGSNAEKFTGNPLQAIGDIDKQVISCTNAMKNKK